MPEFTDPCEKPQRRTHEVTLLSPEQPPETYYAWASSPLGFLRLVSDKKSLLELKFVDQAVPTHSPALPPVLSRAQRWLEGYFNGKNPSLDFPLAPAGTPFQRAVWQETLRIPLGSTATYGELAERLGRSRLAARAVGTALARNPLWLVIPCHRVLGKDSLGGFAGGLWRKKALLEREQPF